MSPEQLLTLVFDALPVTAGTLQATAGFSLLGRQFLADGHPDLVGVFRSDTEAAVEVGDPLFDLLDPDGPTLTVVRLGLALDAVEVGVDAPVVLVLRVDLATTAVAAIDG
ncbi:hypothetical protein [Amycolatopsis sp. NPDC003731]